MAKLLDNDMGVSGRYGENHGFSTGTVQMTGSSLGTTVGQPVQMGDPSRVIEMKDYQHALGPITKIATEGYLRETWHMTNGTLSLAWARVRFPDGVRIIQASDQIDNVPPMMDVPQHGTVRLDSQRTRERVAGMHGVGTGTKISLAYLFDENGNQGSAELARHVSNFAASAASRMAMDTARGIVNAAYKATVSPEDSSTNENLQFAELMARDLQVYASAGMGNGLFRKSVLSLSERHTNFDMLLLPATVNVSGLQSAPTVLPPTPIMLYGYGRDWSLLEMKSDDEVETLAVVNGRVKVHRFPSLVEGRGRLRHDLLNMRVQVGEVYARTQDRSRESGVNGAGYNPQDDNVCVYDEQDDCQHVLSAKDNLVNTFIWENDKANAIELMDYNVPDGGAAAVAARLSLPVPTDNESNFSGYLRGYAVGISQHPEPVQGGRLQFPLRDNGNVNNNRRITPALFIGSLSDDHLTPEQLTETINSLGHARAAIGASFANGFRSVAAFCIQNPNFHENLMGVLGTIRDNNNIQVDGLQRYGLFSAAGFDAIVRAPDTVRGLHDDRARPDRTESFVNAVNVVHAALNQLAELVEAIFPQSVVAAGLAGTRQNILDILFQGTADGAIGFHPMKEEEPNNDQQWLRRVLHAAPGNNAPDPYKVAREELIGDQMTKRCKTVYGVLRKDPLTAVFGMAYLTTPLWSLKAMTTLMESCVQPPFECIFWRLFSTHTFSNGVMMKKGPASGMIAYNNVHVAAACDNHTLEAEISARINIVAFARTPENHRLIGPVQPVGYVGGHGTRVATRPADMENTYMDQRSVSVMATLVTRGHMATRAYPVSFINEPPPEYSRGDFATRTTDEQIWEGGHFYGRYLYGELFPEEGVMTRQNFNRVRDQSLDNYSQLVNHLAFRGFHGRADPVSRYYNHMVPGNGHRSAPEMNYIGAKAYFQGADQFLVPTNGQNNFRLAVSNTYRPDGA